MKNIRKLNTKASNGETLIDYSYKHDNNGNLLEKLGSNDIYYSYDNRNRLSLASYNGNKETFIYDNVGNRTERHKNKAIEKYSYNTKNQLVKLETNSTITDYTYDKQGNLVKESQASKPNNNGDFGDTIYSYNLFNQTEKVITKEGNTLVNRYDAEGLRYEIEENGNLTRFIFNKENILIELDKDDKPVTRLSRGYEVVSSEAENAKFYYHTQDEQESTIGISDEESYFVNSYLYDAFGNILESKEEVHNRIGYTGQQFDPVTQQYYLRARFYNPVVGRFLQEDPYRGDGLNLYAYCHSNPVRYYDPSGYQIKLACDLKKRFNKGNTQSNYTEIYYEGTVKVNGEIRDVSRKVYQRNDIDLNIIDSENRSNLERMLKGLAPLGTDGRSINLHHLTQQEPGAMVELLASVHEKYTKILHGLVEDGESFRNNPVLKNQYNNFRNQYWKNRAKELKKLLGIK